MLLFYAREQTRKSPVADFFFFESQFITTSTTSPGNCLSWSVNILLTARDRRAKLYEYRRPGFIGTLQGRWKQSDNRWIFKFTSSTPTKFNLARSSRRGSRSVTLEKASCLARGKAFFFGSMAMRLGGGVWINSRKIPADQESSRSDTEVSLVSFSSRTSRRMSFSHLLEQPFGKKKKKTTRIPPYASHPRL